MINAKPSGRARVHPGPPVEAGINGSCNTWASGHDLGLVLSQIKLQVLVQKLQDETACLNQGADHVGRFSGCGPPPIVNMDREG